MKKLKLIILLLLTTLTSSYADKFIVESFEKAPNDLAARRYERFDVNDEPCAIIKVKTDLQGLIFEANLGITGDVKKETGEYWLYVSPGEKRIRISKQGYVPKDFLIPSDIRIESHNVYILTLTSDRKYPITVNREPKDATLFMDGENYGIKQMVKNVSVGKHVLKIKKQGFKSIEDTVNVTKDNVKFDYALEEVQPLEVEINTEPQNATILIDDAERGKTNQKMFIFPGTYQLKLTKYLYETVNDTLVVKKDQSNIFSYKLNKSSGTLVVSAAPSGAHIYIDNQKTETNSLEVPAGKHRIRIEKEHYQTISQLVNVKEGQVLKENYTLKPTTGKLYLTTVPEYTETKLFRNGKEVKSMKGDQIINSIQTGTYRVEARANFHEPKYQTIEVKKDETTELSIKLVREHRSKGTAILLSGLIPGSGQLYSIRQNLRGGIYMASGLGAGAMALYYYLESNTLSDKYSDAKLEYENALEKKTIDQTREEMEAVYNDLNKAETYRNYAFMAAGAIYAINLIDAIIWGGGEVPISNETGSIMNNDKYKVAILPAPQGVQVEVTINLNRK